MSGPSGTIKEPEGPEITIQTETREGLLPDTGAEVDTGALTYGGATAILAGAFILAATSRMVRDRVHARRR